MKFVVKDTTESYINNCIDKYGPDKFDYTNTEFKNTTTNLKIKCKKHNEDFEQLPNNHLKGWNGCKSCKKKLREANREEQKKQLAKAADIRNQERKTFWAETINKNLLECRTCKKEQDLTNYTKRRDNANYLTYETECIICSCKRKKEKSHERLLNNGLKYNIKTMMNRFKKRANKKEFDFDIDKEYLEELFNEQKGICSLTGRQLVFDVNNENRLSLDRIDSKKGYVKNNVQWVCWIANNSKQESTMEQWLKLCQDAINHNNSQQLHL